MLQQVFDCQLNQAERKYVAKAAAFGKEVLSQQRFEHEKEAPDLARLRLAVKKGLAAMEVPQQWGGGGTRYVARMRVCEELAYYDAAFTFSLIAHHNIAMRIALSGGKALASEFMPSLMNGEQFACTAMTEPQSGSDFSTMHTHAVREDNGWRLSGTKAWIANASFADVFLVYAQTDPEAGARGVGGFIVSAADPGFTRAPAYQTPTVSGMGVGGFTLTDCLIPEHRLLYPAPGGFKAALQGVNQARVHVAAMCLGMVRNALRSALAYGETRQAFGVPLLEHQGLRWKLADVATQLTQLQTLTYEASRAIDAFAQQAASHDGETTRAANRFAQQLAAMAKKSANTMAEPAISQCLQVMGAVGLEAQYRLIHHLHCARAFCFTDGTPEMMNERIAHLLRRDVL